MSVDTRWCALCGSEYVARVIECAECQVPLVDTPPVAVEQIGDDDEGQVAYELDELDVDDRFTIDVALRDLGIAHAWDGAALVIREADEEAVDAIVDRTGEAAGLDEGDQIAYDLEGWTDDQRAELGDLLVQARIPFEWDESGELVVLEADEERVEILVDSVEFPDQLPVDDDGGDGDADTDEGGAGDDGLTASDTLSELFVAADRLMHDPDDHEGVLALVDAARLAESLAVPYGFAPGVWKDLVGQATELRLLLEGESDDDEVIDKAKDLRGLLRQWV